MTTKASNAHHNILIQFNDFSLLNEKSTILDYICIHANFFLQWKTQMEPFNSDVNCTVDGQLVSHHFLFVYSFSTGLGM